MAKENNLTNKNSLKISVVFLGIYRVSFILIIFVEAKYFYVLYCYLILQEIGFLGFWIFLTLYYLKKIKNLKTSHIRPVYWILLLVLPISTLLQIIYNLKTGKTLSYLLGFSTITKLKYPIIFYLHVFDSVILTLSFSTFTSYLVYKVLKNK